MRLKLLLVSLLMIGGVLYAQDTIKSLIITEARYDDARYAYAELTNMGDVDIDLHDFEFGAISPWDDHYLPPDNKFIMIGDYIDEFIPGKSTILPPGESFWISVAYDRSDDLHRMDPLQYGKRVDLIEQLDADIVLHAYESPSGPEDSVSEKWQLLEVWGGRDALYLRYHLPNGDSAAVDQVGGVWDGTGSYVDRNMDKAYDCAGYTDASKLTTLVRKYSVKSGNLNFAEGRGATLDDSEWIPIPHQKNYTNWSQGRKMMWTVGNHGDYNLDETTLTSDIIDIDWTNHVLNVPWGIHNRDSVMMAFDYHEGLAWHYQLATDTVDGPNWEQAHMDSAYVSARTGDTLIVWACGNDRDEIKFHINVLEPTSDANVIIPMASPNYEDGTFNNDCSPYYEVTNGDPVMDKILNVTFGERTDTIEKYFEKAPNATWEWVFVGDVARPDVVNGDILRVTAEDGTSVKDYLLEVDPYNPSHNADLTSITWPDIPVHYKDVYGYIGDTIPGFAPQMFNYKAIVPSDVEGIPALVAKTDDLNTKVVVKRAVNLYGTVADQTVTFTSSAEDDTTILVYKVQLIKEKSSEDIQPWSGEPFISQYVFRDQWAVSQIEICNPGNLPLDMSDYMIIQQGTDDPAEAITWQSGVDDWPGRYRKYIPGYKWVNEADWAVTPGVLEIDINVDPIVQGGDVFCLGGVSYGQAGWMYGASAGNWSTYWLPYQMDVMFNENEWGETIDGFIGGDWFNSSLFLYKIVGDSIKEGLKPANDPEDFELLDAWAYTEDGNWVVAGYLVDQITSFVRKPEYYKGNPVPMGSFGNTVDNGNKVDDGSSEWNIYDRKYGQLQGYGWAFDILYINTDIGTHYMNEVTEYMSTVSSLTYKVSQGYSTDELIRGLVTGVTVSEFLADITKKDADQVLTVESDGVPLASDAVITNGDSLVVVSMNGDNTSRYLLEVTDDGLSDDAELISSTYDIVIDGATGTVGGFDYGTKLKDVVAGVTLPAGASMDVVDPAGAYVALQKLNFDTVYVATQVSDMIYFVVTAEDGVTTITYQLTPNSEVTDAFVVSEVYDVDQETKVISLVPGGTAVAAFYSNLTPSAGATMQVKDKAGFDRTLGNLYLDDNLTVTAADGETQSSYFLAMLERQVDYLAYVLSNVYVVDQNAYTIVGSPEEDLNEKTLVSAFKANLTVAEGASMVVLDGEGNVKDDADDMDAGDKVVVTAGNGVTSFTYAVTVNIKSVELNSESGIKVYPNPSNGVVNVTGLEAGNRIQVYNSLGARVLDNVVVNTTEIISLDDQGLYFMTISNKAGVIGFHKLIVE